MKRWNLSNSTLFLEELSMEMKREGEGYPFGSLFVKGSAAGWNLVKSRT